MRFLTTEDSDERAVMMALLTAGMERLHDVQKAQAQHIAREVSRIF